MEEVMHPPKSEALRAFYWRSEILQVIGDEVWAEEQWAALRPMLEDGTIAWPDSRPTAGCPSGRSGRRSRCSPATHCRPRRRTSDQSVRLRPDNR